MTILPKRYRCFTSSLDLVTLGWGSLNPDHAVKFEWPDLGLATLELGSLDRRSFRLRKDISSNNCSRLDSISLSEKITVFTLKLQNSCEGCYEFAELMHFVMSSMSVRSESCSMASSSRVKRYSTRLSLRVSILDRKKLSTTCKFWSGL